MAIPGANGPVETTDAQWAAALARTGLQVAASGPDATGTSSPKAATTPAVGARAPRLVRLGCRASSRSSDGHREAEGRRAEPTGQDPVRLPHHRGDSGADHPGGQADSSRRSSMQEFAQLPASRAATPPPRQGRRAGLGDSHQFEGQEVQSSDLRRWVRSATDDVIRIYIFCCSRRRSCAGSRATSSSQSTRAGSTDG